MQYPVEVPGVSVSNFLRTSATAIRGEAPKLRTWVKEVKEAMERLHMDPAFAERNVNEGFSGGEKKRHEILQLELLKPKVAILDETDSGLDVDALRIVSEGVNRVRESGDGRHPADHPLHAHPALHQARLRPRLRRRPDRRVRRRRARRQAGGRGLRGIHEGLAYPRDDSCRACSRAHLDYSTRRSARTSRSWTAWSTTGRSSSTWTTRRPRRSRARCSTRWTSYYERHNANVHRGMHVLAEEATALYEGAPRQGRRASSTRRAATR